ncbi:UDP-N-acetyl-D-glucosamine dehydrogenase [Streptomyces sp. SLBN-118]|uniref:nucleotide sugar dehydrogenase n=1 Tax=Streptomyces sp. SLBN-118 TaxID=2768454 RepID=UPI00114FC0D4|nr:nucleotide sugar dehydrogenase [Streptomyces sp. SLBN-118]TQK50244.1 UDP-N-acetyl-D-glucosamine dehydrogenase [Streptomyces sp. SLBN-118]
MRVAAIGQGYVGLPLSIAIASSGHTLYAVEIDPVRFESLRACRSYIVDVTDEELRRETENERYVPMANLAEVPEVDVYLISTPTPLTDDKRPDLTYVDRALAQVASVARPGALIVVESTVYPGAIRQHVAPLFERLSGLKSGVDVFFAYSPDRVDPGRDAVLCDVPKLVSGLDDQALEAIRTFYGTVFKEVVPVSSCEVAEFTKLLENTFRYLNIAFVNELSKATSAMNISLREVISAASTKPFGFMPFHHGPGVGGHCLPNNVHYLNHALGSAGHKSHLLNAAAEINESMPRHVMQRLAASLRRQGKSLQGATVLILGVAFKSGVADSRNSPAFAIGAELVSMGTTVKVTDPWLGIDMDSDTFKAVELTADECRHADAVVLVTDHEEIDYETVLASSNLIFDCRGMLNAAEVEQL